MSLSLVTRHLSNFSRTQQYRTIPTQAKVRFSTSMTTELEQARKEIVHLKGRIEKLEQSEKGIDNPWLDEDMRFFDKTIRVVWISMGIFVGCYGMALMN